MGQALTLIMLGAIIGLGAAFGLTRLLTKLLFEWTRVNPMTFGAVAVLLLAVALIACYIPAWRATRVDPLEALRCE